MTLDALNQATPSRRYELDWLRIIALSLLIFYHVGMYYSSWYWHVKSPHSNSTVDLFMDLMNPWRLPLLFFISGVAFAYLLEKSGQWSFVRQRTWRLGLVILFGILIIVPPQSYFELISSGGFETGWWSFYRFYLTFNVTNDVITPTWNHLWYVVYILTYALIVAPVLPLLLHWSAIVSESLEQRCQGPTAVVGLLALPALPLVFWQATLTPYSPDTKNLIWDWSNHAHFFTYVIFGVLAARSKFFWDLVDKCVPYAAAVTVGITTLYWVLWPNWTYGGEGVLGWVAPLVRPVFAWSALVLALGLARRFLSHDSAARRYLTEAIFPVYIFHQTITVIAGYYLARTGLGVWAEFSAILALTWIGSFIGFELFRRFNVLRPLVGLKLHAKPKNQERALLN